MMIMPVRNGVEETPEWWPAVGSYPRVWLTDGVLLVNCLSALQAGPPHSCCSAGGVTS